MRPIAGLTVLALLLAGCASEPVSPAGSEASVVPEGTPKGSATEFVNGSITLIGLPDDDECPRSIIRESDHANGQVARGRNVTALLFEILWTHAATDLDLFVRSPPGEGVFPPDVSPSGISSVKRHTFRECSPSSADPRLALLVEDPVALALDGDWTWQVVGKGLVDGEAFQVAITPFADGASSVGFTAFPPPAS